MARRGFIAALVVLAAAIGASSARPATVVVVTGRGWGHGVGMSQWGARGYALHGWDWKRIVAHYYPGTQVSSTANVTVRVLLAASQPGADVACAAGMKVGDATGRTYALPAKTYNVGPGLLVHKHRLQSPVAFYCDGGPLVWDARAYHGVLVVYSGGGRLAVVNSVDLEDYVRGVIADEMPHRWPLAALEAQAVAARSYDDAFRPTLRPLCRRPQPDVRRHGRGDDGDAVRRDADGGPHPHVRRPRGVDVLLRELGRAHRRRARRVAEARPGPVSAFRRRPVRRGVARSLVGAVLPVAAAARGSARRAVRADSRRAQRIRPRDRCRGRERIDAGAGGDATAAPPLDVVRRRRADSLTGSRSSVVYGRRVKLTASAQGMGDASLQELTPSGWRTLRRVATGGRVEVEPRAYTIYRLTAGRVRGPEVGVSVAPAVRARPESSTLLAGQVVPRPSGEVTVSRFVAGGWRVVARPHLDPQGIFHTPLRIRPGGYRIDVAGDSRYAPASKSVRVTSRLLASLHK
ncbi:MAG: hypothetical protein E6F98_05110 [Actinobacteria bacterium]|nr:MAG: hypothetical protein E6F98_05110 [Actinomycetota bacterium]